MPGWPIKGQRFMSFERKKIPAGSISPILAAKWGEDVLDEGYVAFPKRLLRCLTSVFDGKTRLSELQVALAIADYLRPDVTRGPSVEYLAHLAGVQPLKVKRVLRVLKKKGLVDYDGPDDRLQISNEGLQRQILKLTDEKKVKRRRSEEDSSL
jgi:hypothetical protein